MDGCGKVTAFRCCNQPLRTTRSRIHLTPRRTEMKITLTAAAAMSTLGLLTACGATSAPGVAQLGSTPTPSAQAASSSGHSALAYAQCMRSHGVAGFPDPNSQGE